MNTPQYNMVDIWRQMAYPDTLPGEQLDRALNDSTGSSETQSNGTINERLTKVLKRQIECFVEEFKELEEAKEQNDIQGIIDALCDITWVGMMISSIHHRNPTYTMDEIREDYDYGEPGLNSVEDAIKYVNTLYDDFMVTTGNNSSVEAMDIIIVGIIEAILYRCSLALEYIISTQLDTPFDYRKNRFAERAFAEVIYSNFSKIVDGKLHLDETGKITKTLAKERGTYIEPDLSKFCQ